MRAGLSLPEALVALLLGLFVLHLGVNTVARLRAIQTKLVSRTDALGALRITRHVLRRELRHGRAGDDWGAGPDSVWLRAFRGVALVCAADSARLELTVAFEGDRAADPSKDSLQLLTQSGDAVVRDLVAVAAAPGGCGAPGLAPSARWRLDVEAPPDVVIARPFERGSYHLSRAALRYRRGRSGRQPLTPEVWSTATGWRASRDRLALELVPGGADVRTWSGFLSWLGRP